MESELSLTVHLSTPIAMLYMCNNQSSVFMILNRLCRIVDYNQTFVQMTWLQSIVNNRLVIQLARLIQLNSKISVISDYKLFNMFALHTNIK